MKRKLLLFSLLLALFAPWAAQAQTTVEIGDGTTTSYNATINTYFHYSLTQQIFTADEIAEAGGFAGTISSISFNMSYASTSDYTMPSIKLYMLNTDKEVFDSNNDLVDVTDSDIVYEGDFVLPTGGGWITLPVSDFAYEGGNLLVCIYDPTSGYPGSAYKFYCTSTGSNHSSIQWYSDSQNPNPANLAAYSGSKTYNTFHSNIRLDITPGSGPVCNRPDEVIAENITTNSATILWTGGSGTYNVEYKKTTDETWTSAITNTTETSVELTGLTPGTNYQAKVQSVCVFDDTTMYRDRNVNFATSFGIPLIEPFATTTFPTGWSRYTGLLSDVMNGTALTATTSGWLIGNYNNVFDTHTRVNIYGTTCKYWLVTPTLLMEDNVELSFDLALTVYTSGSSASPTPGNQADDRFVVLITTDGGATWEILREWNNTGSEYVYDNITNASTGQYETIDLSSYAGQNIAVAFYGQSTVSGGDNNLHVDNISIDYIPSCPKPSGLAYSEVTGHTALLTWTPNGVGQTQWQICLNGDEENLIPVTSTDGTYTLTGLTGVTPYTAKVRAYCSEEDQSPWSNQVSFTTDVTCVAPTAFAVSDVTNRNVKLSWTSEGTDWIVAYKLTSAPDSTYVEVPVTENPFILEGLAPETGYTVRVRNNCGEVDGLSTWTATRTFTTLVAYPAPTNVAVDSVFAYTAYLSWNELGTAMDWEVAYKLATDTAYTLSELTPDNHPFLLGELDPLTPGTDYVCKVRSIYFTEQGDTASAWSNEVPFTTLLTCPAPTELTVIDSTINAYGATLTWEAIYSDSWNVKYREPAYVDNPLVQEGFDGTSIPTDWTQYVGLFDETTGTATLTTGYRWNFGSNNGVFDSHARTNVYSTYQAWLVTPSLTLGDNIGLSFDVALTKYSGTLQPVDPAQQLDDKFIVMISTDERATWTILRKWDNAGSEYVYNNIACTENGENVSIDLSSYAGQTVYIAFYGESTVAGGDNNLHIDNVAIGTFVPATEWQTVLAEEVPFDLTGLNSETYYEVVVEGNCAEEISEESASVFFTTKPSCLAPTDLVVIDSTITAHTATLSWTENGSATEWVIEYTAIIESPTPTTVTINVTENPYPLMELLPETPYTVRVLAACGENDESQWSNTVNFTTLVACPAPTELAVIDSTITAYNATLTWNGTSDNYILQMADLSAATISEEIIEVFSENFEGGSMPAGWTSEGPGTWTVGTGDYSTSTGAHGGTYNAKINHVTTGNITYLVSPVIDLSACANAKLSCWYINRMWVSDIDGFGVYYRLGNGEWNELFSTTSAHSTWTATEQLSLPSEPNVQIGFKFEDGYGYGVSIDDILIEGNSFAYEWITLDSEATNPYTLEDLTPGTTYMVRVIGDCGEEGESLPSTAISFETLPTCEVPTELSVPDSTITAHTAILHWTGNSNSYNVALGYNESSPLGDFDFTDGIPGTWNNTSNYPWILVDGYIQSGNAGVASSESYIYTTVTYPEDGSIEFDAQCMGEGTSWDVCTFHIDDEEMFSLGAHGEQWDHYTYNVEAGDHTFVWTFSKDGSVNGTGDHFAIDNVVMRLPDNIIWSDTITAATNSLDLSGLTGETTYLVAVQAVCSDEDSSDWTEVVTFTTPASCFPVEELTIDSLGAHIAVLSWVDTHGATAWEICVNGDEDNLIEVVADDAVGDTIAYTYMFEGLSHNTDYTVKVRANCGEEDGASAWRAVSFHTLIACNDPENLTVDNIGTESATLMWEGESDSYVVQYMPWNQVGEDQTSTGVMSTYTFDLSEYSGMGSIAIRHYNVTNMFYLNVDDIEITNAQGDTIFSENFEGNVSPALSIMDLDGDGYNWQIAGGTYNVNGNYGIISASYDNNVGPLTPDNWLIISGVELGGQISFAAVGQDVEWASENFGVFVSPEDGFVEEIVEGDNTLDVWDLTPNTPYSWQVKGVCGEDESQWVASFFSTMDDVLVFVTDGDWDNAENWEPAQLPTTDNNVRIEANAIIPAGVVAEANNVTINGGTITIKDGGQMKLNSQAQVTMEKEIAGYGEGTGNFYLIASPFSGRTLYAANSTGWNHVDSLFVNSYDLYAFDPTYGEGEEWVNYKANSSHIAFQSESQGNQGLIDKEGYLYANQDGVTLAFTGDLSKNINKTTAMPVAYDSINKGWALVGNIYACNAYLSFVDNEGESMEANYWVMNATGDDLEQAETADGIAPLTAAFVYFEGTGEIRISSEEPNPAKYGRTGKFIMNLSQDGNTVDKAVVRFGKGLNLEKMSLKNNSKLYFSMKDKDYAVVYSRNEANMPVSFKAETAGSYTINFAAEGVSFKELVLVDNATETKVDLLANPSYTFETEAGNFAERFTIVYKVK